MNESRRIILLPLLLVAGFALFPSFGGLGVATVEPEQSTSALSTLSTTITTTVTAVSSSFNATVTLTFTNVTTQSSYTSTVTTGATSLFVVTGTTSATLTTTQTSTSTQTSFGLPTAPTCPIAVVSAGSALEPYANSLRAFRDDQILKTFTGRAFMSVFNSWYYGWAPPVASATAEANGVGDALRIGLLPLFGILYASYYTDLALATLNVEVGAISAGAIAASLIGLVYAAPSAYLILRLLRLQKNLRWFGKGRAAPIALISVGSSMLTAWAYLFGSFTIMGVGTAIFTMTMLTLGTVFGIRAIAVLQPWILSRAPSPNRTRFKWTSAS